MGNQAVIRVAQPITDRSEAMIRDVGALAHRRRLADKILAAFNHAYSVGELEIAERLRALLSEADRRGAGVKKERRVRSVARQADLWVTFVEARNRYREVSTTRTSDSQAVTDALDAMKEAYKSWSNC